MHSVLIKTAVIKTSFIRKWVACVCIVSLPMHTIAEALAEETLFEETLSEEILPEERLPLQELSSKNTAKQCVDGTETLNRMLDTMQSLSSQFHQEIKSADAYSLQDMSGEMHIAKPGRIYWASEAPYEQRVIADGENLWLYDPDLEQVTLKSLAENLIDSPAALLIGEADHFAERYRICSETSNTTIATTTATTTKITLTPLQAGSIYTKLTLTFVDDVPGAINMYDSLGQHTAITLINPVMNPALDASLFIFQPPAGVDIFEDR